jgi:aspartate aminotransferase
MVWCGRLETGNFHIPTQSAMNEYLHITRKILRILAKYLMNRLAHMKVTAPYPQGAFYLFPDFSYYRQKLTEKGILTSGELCNKLLLDTGVAILPGTDFGRQPEELSARIAYVDFDGEKAIQAAKNTSFEHNHNDEFIKKYCPNIVEGFDRLEQWLNDL